MAPALLGWEHEIATIVIPPRSTTYAGERAGHATLLLDAHLHDLSLAGVVARPTAFRPDRFVVTTAPSCLFWRCAPSELRVPRARLGAFSDIQEAHLLSLQELGPR